MSLKSFLDPLYDEFNRRKYLSSDPLEFAHRYSDPWDQEAIALISAMLAYGNVKQIRRSVEDVLSRIEKAVPEGAGGVPARFVRLLGQDRPGFFRPTHSRAFQGFVHRFNRGEDVLLLFRLLSESWKRHGSLGAHFVGYLKPEDRTIAPALNALIAEWKGWAREWGAGESFFYFLTAPKDGSCCKRWCMFLRWMGRQDELDLGLWREGASGALGLPAGRGLRSDQLVIPLDTHTGRISQYLGLTSRKSLNWLAAEEVTEELRKSHPTDPTRYDFALARLGILDLCQRKFNPSVCMRCQLLPVCRFARRRKVRLEPDVTSGGGR